jgi:hypothetical protein
MSSRENGYGCHPASAGLSLRVSPDVGTRQGSGLTTGESGGDFVTSPGNHELILRDATRLGRSTEL